MDALTMLRSMTGYYGLVDSGGRIFLDFLWLTSALALLVHLWGLSASRKAVVAEDDPYEVALTDPVGKWAKAAAARNAGSARMEPGRHQWKRITPGKKAMVAGSLERVLKGDKEGKAKRRPLPVLHQKASILGGISAKSPNRDSFFRALSTARKCLLLHAPKTGKDETTTAVPLILESEGAKEGIDERIKEVACEKAEEAERTHSESQGRTYAIAEIDFIRAACAQDLIGLKRRFGFVFVPAKRYAEAAASIGEKGLDASSLLISAPDEQAQTTYASIATARKTNAIVLSDSENIGRLCRKYEIPCWNLTQWRRETAPHT